jgi:hypothetical protein
MNDNIYWMEGKVIYVSAVPLPRLAYRLDASVWRP